MIGQDILEEENCFKRHLLANAFARTSTHNTRPLTIISTVAINPSLHFQRLFITKLKSPGCWLLTRIPNLPHIIISSWQCCLSFILGPQLCELIFLEKLQINPSQSFIMLASTTNYSRTLASRMLAPRAVGLRMFSGVNCEPAERLRTALMSYRNAK